MFKRGKVVMLPTNNKAKIEYNFKDNRLDIFIGYLDEFDRLKYKPNHPDAFKQFMELYIVTNDAIHAGDWVTDGKKIFHIPIELDGYINLYKVIATTDANLDFITSPSPAFIEKYVSEYNKGRIINDILVEYVDTHWNGNLPVPKIDSKDGTITIRPIKTIWTKDEVAIELANAIKLALANPDLFSTLDYTDHNKINNWINKQL